MDKQITKRLPQILVRESTTTNRNNIPSILTSVSTIDENIASVQTEGNLHLELSSSIPQLSSLGDGSNNIMSAMQQITSTQALQKPVIQVGLYSYFSYYICLIDNVLTVISFNLKKVINNLH